MNRIRILILLAAFAVLVLIAPSQGFALTAPGSSGYSGGTGSGAPGFQECFTCSFFDQLELASDDFTAQIYNEIGPALHGIMKSALIGYVLVYGLLMILGKYKVEQLPQVANIFILTSIAIVMTNDYTVYQDWVHEPLQRLGLGLGGIVLDLARKTNSDLPPPGTHSGYSQLIHMVEIMVWGVFRFCADMLTSGGGLFNPVKAIAAIMLMIPYLFVLALFSAFLIEAMFKFVAIGVAAPLLIAGIPYQFTRAFATSGFRILLGAVLTIFFAAAAMGFTMSTVHSRVIVLESQYGFAAFNLEKKRVEQICATGGGFGGEDANVTTDACALATANLSEMNERVQNFGVFTSEFFVLFVIGFVSILLHLQAKSLASNLSGSQDGAGPAAAVVGGGQMLLGGGMLAAKKIAFGQAGGGGFAQGIGNMIPGGSGLAAGGVAGGAASGVQKIVGAFSGNGGESSGAGWNKTTGPGGGGSFKGFDDKQMKTLGTMIGSSVGEAVKQAMGRNREGR